MAFDSTRTPSIRLVAAVVAATLIVQTVGVAAWRLYHDWLMGHVVLTNDGPPLSVQVLDESGTESIGGPVTLIRRATLDLPEGDYRLRITGEGRLSRVYRFNVNRGESHTQSLTLDDDRMLGGDEPHAARDASLVAGDPIPFTPQTVAIELTPGGADFVTLSPTALSRREADSGQVIWDALVAEEAGPTFAARSPLDTLVRATLRGAPPDRPGRTSTAMAAATWSGRPARDAGRLGQGRVGPLDLPGRARRPRRCPSRGPGAPRADPAGHATG